MKSIFISLSIFFVFNSCQTSSGAFTWMEGSWMMEYPNGKKRLESWKLADNKKLLGKGISINGQDSVIVEYLKVDHTPEGVFYVPTVPDQNEGKEVRFKLTNKRDELIFENPDHDFPQRIRYRFMPSHHATDVDSMYVRVESLDGDGIDYWFRRL
jgi:hypothetical protein